MRRDLAWYKPGVADDNKPPEDALEFVTANLAELTRSLPQLAERLRALAHAQGRGGELTQLPDSEAEQKRIEAFVSYLKMFGRADSRPATPLPPAALLDAALDYAGGEITRRARLIKRYDAAPRVLATERQLGQVFLSLLINAAQALPEGHVDDNRVEVRVDTGPDGWARIELEDSGHGIPEDLLPRIFDPFFSTKRGAGAGIGLAIVRDTIQSLGGRLSVQSEVGRGTTFRIELPPAP